MRGKLWRVIGHRDVTTVNGQLDLPLTNKLRENVSSGNGFADHLVRQIETAMPLELMGSALCSECNGNQPVLSYHTSSFLPVQVESERYDDELQHHNISIFTGTGGAGYDMTS